MSVLPFELRDNAQGELWLAEFDHSLRAARKTLARRETIVFAAATLWLATLLSTLWVLLVRFTLIDLPKWPALLFPMSWLLALVVVRSTRRIGSGESARYLDRALGLDERVATSLELVRSTPVAGLHVGRVRLPRTMLADTAFHLHTKRNMLPSGWGYSLRRWQWAAVGAALLVLVGAILLPTPLDQVRAERAELQRAVRDEIAQVEQLRAELIERPGLDDASKASINRELQRLLDILATPQIDRSAMLAAIADTQERLHDLSPQAPSDFLGVIAAAKTVQNSTVAAVRNGTVQSAVDLAWSPDNFPDLSDLGKAADAARTLSGWIVNLNSAQLRALSEGLERAEGQAAPEDATLAQNLLDSSQAVSVKDLEKSASSLESVSDSFLAADKHWQLAGAVEKALADLDDGRQALAQAGAQEVNKGQVGFRRPGAPTQASNGAGGGTPAPVSQAPSNGDDSNTDGSQGISKNDPSAFGQQMGLNSPDFNVSKGSQASGGQTAAGANGQGNSQGGSRGGGAGSSQGGGQPGGSAGGGTGDSQGTFGGQVTGPVGGANGAISQVQNPSGRGVSPQGGSTNNSDSGDALYIPPTAGPSTSGGSASEPGNDGNIPGQAAPGDPNQDGIEGRGGGAGDTPETTTDRGGGVRTEIHTPYKEVYGAYAQQAAQALEGQYIPSDAKEYVKEYFTELGK